jgi:hypothetical protein
LESEEDHQIYQQVENTAQQRNLPFIPVRLSLSRQENEKRIQNPQRKLRYKATKINEKLINIPLIKISHPNLLDLDISHLRQQLR